MRTAYSQPIRHLRISSGVLHTGCTSSPSQDTKHLPFTLCAGRVRLVFKPFLILRPLLSALNPLKHALRYDALYLFTHTPLIRVVLLSSTAPLFLQLHDTTSTRSYMMPTAVLRTLVLAAILVPLMVTVHAAPVRQSCDRIGSKKCHTRYKKDNWEYVICEGPPGGPGFWSDWMFPERCPPNEPSKKLPRERNYYHRPCVYLFTLSAMLFELILRLVGQVITISCASRILIPV